MRFLQNFELMLGPQIMETLITRVAEVRRPQKAFGFIHAAHMPQPINHTLQNLRIIRRQARCPAQRRQAAWLIAFGQSGLAELAPVSGIAGLKARAMTIVLQSSPRVAAIRFQRRLGHQTMGASVVRPEGQRGGELAACLLKLTFFQINISEPKMRLFGQIARQLAK